MSDPNPVSALQTVPRGTPLATGIDYRRFLDCVHCGLCTAACPTYVITGDENDSPRGRIYLMRGVTDGRIALSSEVERHLELCLDCRACETACPSGVQYGNLIEPFRAALTASGKERSGRRDWFERLVLLGIFPHAARLRAALAPVRVAQGLGLDRVASALGLGRFLPSRARQLARMLPTLATREPPLPEFLPAIGPRRARVALFTGCVGDAVFRATNWATARVLQHNGCDVLVPRGQGCCGAIHYHAGEPAAARELANVNVIAFRCETSPFVAMPALPAAGAPVLLAKRHYTNGGSHGKPPDVDVRTVDAIITNVAGCGAMLKEYGHHWFDGHRELRQTLAAKTLDVCEFLDDLGLIAPRGEVPLVATYHDACHLAHAQRIREAPLRLLAQVPGLKLVELPESELCCGAAGTYNLTEPEMAGQLAARKLDRIASTGAQAVIAGNAGCLLQISAEARQRGLALQVLHPVEILDRTYRGLPSED